MRFKLYNYWRSGPSYRVRIALALKGLAYEYAPINLAADGHHDPAYRAIQEQGLVPALEVDGRILIQSPAILEWLDEAFPAPPLLPQDPWARAQVRALAALIACDIHPLHNLRVRAYFRDELAQPPEAFLAFARRMVANGFAALEERLDRLGWTGPFVWGEHPTLADCMLVPQAVSSARFDVDLAPFPRIRAITAAASAHPAFAEAHPNRQPDAPLKP